MVMANNSIETLLNEHDVARFTGLSVASVRRWRLLRQGPKYLKIGAAVRYKPEDISAWLESRPSGGAHRTLPFNTWVRVYNLNNNKTVDVRIIDRGPFVDGRIIDLSHAAAQAIDMIGPGIAQVRVEILSAPATVAPTAFAVQVGAFRDRANAERARAGMQARYGRAQVVLEQGFWRVLVGQEATEKAAEALAARIRQDSPENKTSFVVRIDLTRT